MESVAREGERRAKMASRASMVLAEARVVFGRGDFFCESRTWRREEGEWRACNRGEGGKGNIFVFVLTNRPGYAICSLPPGDQLFRDGEGDNGGYDDDK